MTLYTLGKLSLSDSRFDRLKPLVLLAYLGMEGQQSRAHLSHLFWPDAQNPLGALSVALTRLRQVAPEAVQSDLHSVKSAVPSDAQAFLEAVEQQAFKKALSLYKGPFLEGVLLPDWTPALEDWVYTTRETLATHARNCLLNLAQHYADEGRLDLSVHHAERAYTLRAAPPLEDETLTQLYGLLSEGKSELAQTVVAEANELGLTLGAAPAKQQVTTQIPPPSSTLPPKTPLVGRHAELAALADQLGQPACRLLTLTGLGGVGKSSLALELAHTQFEAATFRDGVYFVPLEPLQSPELIPAQIADVLELSANAQPSRFDLIKSFLAQKQLLLVLDNFEHLLPGAAGVSELLLSCPELKCVVTSRTRLNLKNEWIFRVGGLTYPERGEEPLDTLLTYDAPELFVRRAQQTLVNLKLSKTDYPDLAKLCELTGGMPLALELSAAWLRTVSLAEVVQELTRGLELLSQSFTDGEARHTSITGVISQSWERLAQKEQTALLNLCVFEGGFNREASSQAADVSISTLRELIDSSMLDQEPGGRYSFHPLIKQFLEGQLQAKGDDDAARTRHARYFLTLAETAEPQLIGKEQGVWLERLNQELDNLRAALEWSIGQKDADTALRLAGALGDFWARRGYAGEGLRWLSRALVLSGGQDKSARIKALSVAGGSAESLGDLDAARRYLEKGLELNESLGNKMYEAMLLEDLGIVMTKLADFSAARAYLHRSLEVSVLVEDKNQEARVYRKLGYLEMQQGSSLAARSHFKKSLKISEILEDEYALVVSYMNLAMLECYQGQHSVANPFYRESLVIAERMQNQALVALSLFGLGFTEAGLGNLSASETYYESSFINFEKLGNLPMTSRTLNNLGELAIRRGVYTEAKQRIHKSLKISKELGINEDLIESVETCAWLACETQQLSLAVKLWATAEAARQKIGLPRVEGTRQAYEERVSTTRTALGEEAFTAAWKAGEQLSLEETVAFVLEQ